MVSKGLLGRRDDMRIESLETGRISAGGVLAQGDFPPSDTGLVGESKETCRRLIQKREDVMRLADDVDVQVFDLSQTQDLHYCNHSKWSGLVLCAEADWPMGITPVICCECGGLVARFRVPVSQKTASNIWSFCVESFCVEACWSASGVLEAWANGERHDPLSRINTLGLSIVKSTQSDTGIDTWLYIPLRTSTTATTCPLCEEEMSSLDSPFFWNYRCSDCRIVTSNRSAPWLVV